MSPRRRPAPDPFPETGLAALGLARGDVVRFRRSTGERWKQATVLRREKDGSVGLADARGAARAIAVDAIEVRTVGPRGGTVWEPLAERAARTEQLPLVRGASDRARAAGPRGGSTSGSGTDPGADTPGPPRRGGGPRLAVPDAGAEQLPLLE